ncbi:MAG TPA: hypothetical protein VFY97_11200 [Rhodanobacteraceae bacterium]|nr:hypothetical protein [Rhodanobacteraceae bacterium]
MPTVNDEFNRTCVRLDLDPARSGVFTPNALTLEIKAADLARFNECAARVAPGTPVLNADQIAGAARRLARAVGAGNESRFIQIRMRRAGEIRALLKDSAWTVEPALSERMQELIAYLDGPVALVPADVPLVGGLDRALLVDLAMEGLRAELDEYADFCRYRAAEAQRLGVSVDLVDVDRGRWMAERSLELQLERQVRRARGTGYGGQRGGTEVFHVS